jgi:uncharacterized protein YjhX (UPF0386 family)
MNIAKHEQRVLHTLAQGGHIRHRREDDKIVEVECFTREGHRLAGFEQPLFARLKKRGFIASRNGQPYRISPLGLLAVRAQADNR